MDFDSLVPESTPIKVVEKVEEDKECDPWLWNGKPIYTIPTEHETFVYLITNKINGKRYVGFKTSVSQKTKVVNKKKKKCKVESDWQSYWSSSENLQEDVRKYGKKNFMREILWFSVNKSVGKYLELYEQIVRGVLTDSKDKYYNGIVNVRLNGRTVQKITQAVHCTVCLGDKLNEK